MRLMAFTVFFALLSLTAEAQDTTSNCFRPEWPQGMRAKNAKAALNSLLKAQGLSLRRDMNPNGECQGEWSYSLVGRNGRVLVGLSLPESGDGSYDAEAALSRVSTIIKTPRADFRRLTKARTDFDEEIKAIQNDFGFAVVDTLDQADFNPTTGKVRLRLAAPKCDKDGRRIPGMHALSDGDTIEIDFHRYHPQKRRYREGEVFRPGQVRAMLVRSRELMRKMGQRAQEIANSCTKEDVIVNKTRQEWADAANRLIVLAGDGPRAPVIEQPSAK